MPTTVKVRVNTINADAKQGSYDAVEITGFDLDNNRGFKKKFFATKKDGSATKNAETAYTLNKDDWCEITLDDTKFNNVQTIKPIAAPAGAENVAPSQGGGAAGAKYSNKGKGGGGNQMSKEECAEKDRKKEAAIARNSSLKAAVEFMKVVGKVAKKDNVELTLDVARKFEAYLTIDDKEPGDEQGIDVAAEAKAVSSAPDTAPVEDDDIPF